MLIKSKKIKPGVIRYLTYEALKWSKENLGKARINKQRNKQIWVTILIVCILLLVI